MMIFDQKKTNFIRSNLLRESCIHRTFHSGTAAVRYQVRSTTPWKTRGMSVESHKKGILLPSIMTYHGCMLSSSKLWAHPQTILRKNEHSGTSTTESAQTKLCQAHSSRGWRKKRGGLMASNDVSLGLSVPSRAETMKLYEIMKMAAFMVFHDFHMSCSCCLAEN